MSHKLNCKEHSIIESTDKHSDYLKPQTYQKSGFRRDRRVTRQEQAVTDTGEDNHDS